MPSPKSDNPLSNIVKLEEKALAVIDYVERVEQMLFVDMLTQQEIMKALSLTRGQFLAVSRAITQRASALSEHEWADTNRLARMLSIGTLDRVRDLKSRLPDSRNAWEAAQLHKEIREQWRFLLDKLQDLGIVYRAPVKLEGGLTLTSLLAGAGAGSKHAGPVDDLSGALDAEVIEGLSSLVAGGSKPVPNKGGHPPNGGPHGVDPGGDTSTTRK